MLKTVVNLTQHTVIAEIERVLDTYPFHPYQQAFAIPDLRQELIAYVLSRIPCFYRAIQPEEVEQVNYKFPSQCWEQQLQLENLISQGIYCVLQDQSDWVSNHIPEPEQCGLEPSHWFG